MKQDPDPINEHTKYLNILTKIINKFIDSFFININKIFYGCSTRWNGKEEDTLIIIYLSNRPLKIS